MALKIAGVDPSLRNFGIVRAEYEDDTIKIINMELVKTNKKSSGGGDYIRRASKLFQAFSEAVDWADIVMAEIPNGSRSSNAAWALGIVVGVLASCDKPIVEIRSKDVKLVATGEGNASKQEVIDWAYDKYPEADWLWYRGRMIHANEHLADAIAVIHAGIKKKEFKRLLKDKNNGQC